MLSYAWTRSSSGVAPASTRVDTQPLPSVSSILSQTPPKSLPPSSDRHDVTPAVRSVPARPEITKFACLADYDEALTPCSHMLPFFVVRILWRVAESDPVLSSWLSLVGIEPNPGPVHAKKATTPHKMREVVVVMPPKQQRTKKNKEPRITPRAVGSALGGWVGELAGKAIRAITGFGDYKVSHNSLINSSQIPQFSPNSRSVLFRRREFVGIVSSPGAAFTTSTYRINPMSSFFPWLSEIAGSFEQFVVHGMVVEFKSTSATAVSSTNTALGSVILATQYNILTPPFSSQQQMEAYDYVTSTCPCVDMIHPVECAPGMTSIRELYVDGNYGGDPRLSTLGVTTLATVGQQAASTIGELWVSYDIEMIRPKLLGGIPTTGMSYSAKVFGLALTSQNLFGGLGQAFPIGSLPNGSDLDVGYPVTPGTVGDQRSLSFPIGTSGAYLIEFGFAGVAGPVGIASGLFAVANGVSLSNFFASGTSDHVSTYGVSPQFGNSSTVVLWRLLAVFYGSPFPLYGNSLGTPLPNSQRPIVTFPLLQGNDGSQAISLNITPVSFFA